MQSNIEKLAENQDKIVKKVIDLLNEIEKHDKRIYELEKIVSGHSTILVKEKGEAAHDFHTSFDVKKPVPSPV